MKSYANWFSGLFAAIILAAQTPQVAALLGPYGWIVGLVGTIGTSVLHNAANSSAPPANPSAN